MASACSSSLSIQKSTSGRRKSIETVCSSNSSCFLHKKKPVNPLAVSVRMQNGGGRGENSVVRQRVMSAKMTKLRNLQSQLNDANFHLMELAKENRALKTLQKRQDKALNNYEGINADLPRLIKSHEEENRTLTEKNRGLKRQLKELSELVKIKDEELITVRDQLRHLTTLSKDRNLGEREKLTEQLEDARVQLKKHESEIALLNRKLLLESKNSKQKLNLEVTKHKKCQRELAQALMEIDVISEAKDSQEKEKPVKRRFSVSPRNRQSHSLVCLNSRPPEESPTEAVSNLKLEPILKRAEGGDSTKSSPDTMQSPAEKIKARLSSGGEKEKRSSVSQINDILEKLSMEEENLKKALHSRPLSTRLETLPKSLEKERAAESTSNSVGSAEERSEDFEDNEEKVLESVKTVKGKIGETRISDLMLNNDDLDLVNRIWSEEYTFRKENSKDGKSEPCVALEDKKKLLATLRDIDNGKSVDHVIDNSNIGTKKNRLIKELFG